jgi:hypothetical protein
MPELTPPRSQLQSPDSAGTIVATTPADVTHRLPANGQPAALTPTERDRLVRSVVSSQALEGVEVGYDQTSRLLDAVLREPLVDLG